MITSYEQLLETLDELMGTKPRLDWDEFYTDRERNVPFFTSNPDENLVSYVEDDKLTFERVLELGCGNGRNAHFLAENGSQVLAVDQSREAIRWAKETVSSVDFIQADVLKLDVDRHAFDLIYDSGCFHHLAPHQRIQYLTLVHHALKPGGYYAVSCFKANGPLGGAVLTDVEIYRQRSLQGGLGFTKDDLEACFTPWKPIEIRDMRETDEEEQRFGKDGLLVARFQKGE
ncbi:LOW QUALITY PROTEIN: methyltransferase [Geomicrobium sp. JCM 19037]|nr:LOW QUALITY PROTEIN: methyltransferase [Geomicrobium sp. JCM 19037]